MTEKRRKQQRSKRGEQQTVTRAITHIRLEASNAGKLAALDALAEVYLALTQQYILLFCTDEIPNDFRAPCFPTPLSERWQRNAIQQAAGITRSWRSNRANAYQDYQDRLAAYQKRQQDGQLAEGVKALQWCEWNVPTLRTPCIQANSNVVVLEPATDSSFDYWVKISILEFRKQALIPVKLADYQKQQLTDPETGKRRRVNSSVTLNKRDGGWWLTLTYDEAVTVLTAPDAPIIGLDVGIANFVTTSSGRHYGSLDKKMRERLKRDREKRRRKAKLRACLEKKGVPKEKLPSTTSRTGQRLIRHVNQEINRAVKRCVDEHKECQFAYEQLSVASMRFKARSMNAYLWAVQLGQIPRQIEWQAKKRGMQATRVKSAYSSQACHVCCYVDRSNRPNQGTFSCGVCHHTTHADRNAAENLASRLNDQELRACQNRQDIKALLMRRHEQWKQNFRIVVVDPPVQLGLWASSQSSTDVG